jgi:hypothetical protein
VGQAAERRGLQRPDGGVEGPLPDFGCWAAQKQGRREKKVFLFKKTTKQMNSNRNLNSNTQKQCIIMYATINSYISLFN